MRRSPSSPRQPRRWRRWALGGVVAAIVAVVGGPFLYFHFVEGKAPAPLSLASQLPSTTTGPSTTAVPGATTTTAGSGASAAAGVWNVGSGSVAGYRIKETLFGQSHTAVGRTSAITGSFTLAGTSVT
jgi:hypothetical protein